MDRFPISSGSSGFSRMKRPVCLALDPCVLTQADCLAALQKHMLVLEDHGISGGERSDAIDYCLAGIAKLSNEVKDASSYLPPYDQRTYGEVSIQRSLSLTSSG